MPFLPRVFFIFLFLTIQINGSVLTDQPQIARRIFLESVKHKLSDLKLVQARLKHHQKRLLVRTILDAGKQTAQDAKLIELIRRTDKDRVEMGVEGADVINQPFADLMFQSDMMINVEQAESLAGNSTNKRSKRQAQTGPSFPLNQWSVGTPISYHIDSSIDPKTRRLIRMAIKHWEEHTCLRFEENGYTQPIVKFFKGGGCFSQVGRDFGAAEQIISIGKGCEQFGIITHEIAHTLGYFHAQARHDRDSYIDVIYPNLSPYLVTQFVKQSSRTNNNFGVNYDYGSNMHYADVDPARGVVTMMARRRIYQHTMGNNIGPSFTDILEMNIYYNCARRCKNSITCMNGGFYAPNNCNKCICPLGFGGDDCTEIQQGQYGMDPECGQVISANGTYQTLSNRIDAIGSSLADRHAACYWHIKAPRGQRIQVKILNVYGACSAGCFYAGLEIKIENFIMTGARICCESDLANMGWLESESNMAIIHAYTAFRSFGFKLKFRAVGNPVDGCEDKRQGCSELAHLCSNQRYYKLMTSNCAKTCMRCVAVIETPTTSIRNIEPEIEEPEPPECGEKTECKDWLRNGFCESQFFTEKLKKQYCGVSCKLCQI